jgi:primosomal protein N'
MPLVRVAVPIPLPDRETLVYELPDEEEFQAGLRVFVPVGSRRVLGTVLDLEPKQPSFRVRRIAGIPEPRLVLTEELLRLCRWIADYYATTLGEVLHAATPSPTGLTRRAPRSTDVEEEGWRATEPPGREALNPDQRAALEALEGALGDPAFHPFLLYGVTGSGKTAVYLHAALDAVRRGGQALILVPEIALSPQALDAFRRSGLQRVALYHSTLRPRERADVWRAVAAGELDLVVGTRSAVLLPFRDLRLLVVDEEQDGAYKQEDSPRYHARDVALVRAQRLGATVVLSSATPSLESYARAKRGTYALLSLPHRVDGRPLATVRVADLRIRGTRDTLRAGERGSEPGSFASRHLSPILTEAMARTLERHEQGILFLNRRGHSTYLQCRGCGDVARCERCDVSLTVHSEDSTLRCHYCGAQRRLTPSCRGCGATDLWFGGVGIQKIEREVARMFPEARIARLDFDAVKRRGAAAAILGAFRDGRTDFLLGTQMVTKGFHFPGVTLVESSPPISSSTSRISGRERTFQLLTQVAAARGAEGPARSSCNRTTGSSGAPGAAAQDYAAFSTSRRSGASSVPSLRSSGRSGSAGKIEGARHGGSGRNQRVLARAASDRKFRFWGRLRAAFRIKGMTMASPPAQHVPQGNPGASQPQSPGSPQLAHSGGPRRHLRRPLAALITEYSTTS